MNIFVTSGQEIHVRRGCVYIYTYIFFLLFFSSIFFFFLLFFIRFRSLSIFPFFFVFCLYVYTKFFYRIPEQLRDPVIRCYTALGKCSGSGCNFYFFFFNFFSRCEKYLVQTKGKIALVSMAASRLTLPQRWLPIADRKKKRKKKKNRDSSTHGKVSDLEQTRNFSIAR